MAKNNLNTLVPVANNDSWGGVGVTRLAPRGFTEGYDSTPLHVEIVVVRHVGVFISSLPFPHINTCVHGKELLVTDLVKLRLMIDATP